MNGYGLWAVDEKASGKAIGICGFVRRDTLPGPDIGFAFLPDFEGRGYGTEAAAATLLYGQEKLGFERVLAITSLQNFASIALLEKIGFKFEELIVSPLGEELRLFSYYLDHSTSDASKL